MKSDVPRNNGQGLWKRIRHVRTHLPLLVLLLLIQFTVSGCSMVGLVIGDVIDNTKPYMVAVDNPESLLPKTVVMVISRDGIAHSGTVYQVTPGESIKIKYLEKDRYDKFVEIYRYPALEQKIEWDDIDRIYIVDHKAEAKTWITRFTYTGDLLLLAFMIYLAIAMTGLSGLS